MLFFWNLIQNYTGKCRLMLIQVLLKGTSKDRRLTHSTQQRGRRVCPWGRVSHTRHALLLGERSVGGTHRRPYSLLWVSSYVLQTTEPPWLSQMVLNFAFANWKYKILDVGVEESESSGEGQSILSRNSNLNALGGSPGLQKRGCCFEKADAPLE